MVFWIQTKATENLMSLSHTLKLMFLLDHNDQAAQRPAAVQREHALQELEDAKLEAKQALENLLEGNTLR